MTQTDIKIGPIRPKTGQLAKATGAAVSSSQYTPQEMPQTVVQLVRDVQALQDQIWAMGRLLDQTIAVPMLIASGPNHQAGVAPDPGATAGTTKFLRESGDWQNIDVAALPQMARARAYKAAAQSISNTTHTALVFDTDDYNVGGLHSTSVNNTRFTAQTTGLHLAMGQVGFAANAGGSIRQIDIQQNGSFVTPIPSSNIPPTGGVAYWSVVPVFAVLPLNAGDYIEFVAFQDSGGALNTQNTVTWGSLTFLGR